VLQGGAKADLVLMDDKERESNSASEVTSMSESTCFVIVEGKKRRSPDLRASLKRFGTFNMMLL
jgi:hypothetical protein